MLLLEWYHTKVIRTATVVGLTYTVPGPMAALLRSVTRSPSLYPWAVLIVVEVRK